MREKWPPFCRRRFQLHFLEFKVLPFDSTSWQYISIGIGNNLWPRRDHYLNQSWPKSTISHGVTRPQEDGYVRWCRPHICRHFGSWWDETTHQDHAWVHCDTLHRTHWRKIFTGKQPGNIIRPSRRYDHQSDTVDVGLIIINNNN